MTTQQTKRIIGLLLLGAFLGYFVHKLFTSVDSTLLAVLILALVAFVIVLIAYILKA